MFPQVRSGLQTVFIENNTKQYLFCKIIREDSKSLTEDTKVWRIYKIETCAFHPGQSLRGLPPPPSERNTC